MTSTVVMPFHDLNVAYSSNDAEVSNTLAFLAELAYAVVALSIDVASKLPAQLPTVSTDRLKIPSSLHVLSRLTLTVSDNAQNHRINSLISTYDVVALRPTDEKTFQLCCSSLECDLISLDFSQRVPFAIKFKTVASALQRGIRFEICYSLGITGGNDARRNLIAGAAALIRATRGRGIILSSEAKNALGIRAPWDVINLAQVWGLSQERGKEAICEEAGRVLRLASIKRTSFRGVVDIIEDGSRETAGEPAAPDDGPAHTADASLSKQQQPEPAPKAPLELPQVTMVPSKMSNPEKSKRKASMLSLNDAAATSAAATRNKQSKPLSKREQKRQAKKARFERAAGRGGSGLAPTSHTNGFSIQ